MVSGEWSGALVVRRSSLVVPSRFLPNQPTSHVEARSSGMIGQCAFCRWYGVRLRRTVYQEGGGARYHPHCVRVALNSPDPAERGRAEKIVREEMTRRMRDR